MRTNFFEAKRTPRSRASKALTFGLAMILALLVLLLGLQAATKVARAADPFTVDRSDDPDLSTTPAAGACTAAADNDCSLRGAINAANDTSGPDTIDFAIPDDSGTSADDVKTILVDGTDDPASSTNLPEITEAVIINGYTQRPCLTNAEPCSKPNTNTVLAQGTNANLLIVLDGANPGSSDIGLTINASDVVVKGLVITRFPTGVFIAGGGSRAVIEGNFIGTDLSGTQNPGNANNGVNVFGSDNTIGGQEPAARNLISGNFFRGLDIAGNGGNTIQGNLIGTKAKGTNANEPEPLGNGLEGVQIFSPNNTVGNSTGGDEAGANLIAFNGGDGVQVTGGRNNAFAVGNRILSNSIFSNGDLSIDLDGGEGFSNPDGDGVTINDKKDRDTGPNTLQNFPKITSATTSGVTTTVTGKLSSTPGKRFTIQLFSNTEADLSGFGEGKTLLGRKTVTTNDEGKASFTFKKILPAGENLVAATATRLVPDPNDPTKLIPQNTSEFSKAVRAQS